MGVRVGLGVVTVGVLAGELATAWRSPPAAVLAVAGLVALACAWRGGALVWVAVILAAFDVGAVRMRTVTSPAFAPEDVARLALPLATTLRGRIVAPPVRDGRRLALLVAAESVGGGARRRPVVGLVHLTLRDPARRWRYGERLAAWTKLRRPRNFANPGSFDFVAQLARRGVHVTASVWEGRDVRHLGGRARGLRVGLERWRTRLSRAIAAAVPPPEGSVLRALVVGDEDDVAPDVRDAFTRAGVIHVLSISGLHVGLVAVVAFASARWLLGRSERLLLGIDVARVAAVTSLGPVALYAALAGLGVPTLRSAFMVTAAVIAALLGRRADVLRTLALAALVLALLWPGTPLEIGFQLSFGSVLAIACGTRRIAPAAPKPASWGARAWQAVAASPCALAGTAPLTAFHFHQLSLVSVIANPLTIPIFGAVVVVLGLVGAVLEPFVPSAAAVLFGIAGLVLHPGIALVRALAAPDWAAIDVPIPNLVELALLYALLAGLVLLPRRGARLLVAVALAGLVADGGWWLHERFGRDALR
ncbi:MAG TPA: ComEC/Rec2 family competence protein, partial [Candidatus Binatia bacterium]|nr:ComEC/Rec2 family competence protein [Candidatus Binatia bacterium]